MLFFNDLSFDNFHSNKYNLIQNSDKEIVLELDVAGIPKSNINIEVLDNILTVSSVEDAEKKYLYNGFNKKRLNYKFTLTDDVDVKDAMVQNGILSIFLEIKNFEKSKPRKIKIKH